MVLYLPALGYVFFRDKLLLGYEIFESILPDDRTWFVYG